MSATVARWTCAPFATACADSIARELGVSPTLASILVRRGHDTAAAARGFLAGDERHEPALFEAMGEACELVMRHVARRSRIVVYGDYDVDGVCSTAVAVRALRAVGADPAWQLPSRIEDGYGLSPATVERLADEGADLLITVDCGITAATEVALARDRGIDVLVTDHHRPGTPMPDCPILHPGLGGYPFAGLCATAVVHKLSEALRTAAGFDPRGADDDLDLTALATICDVVPLTGENRRLVKEGMRALARTTKPGLRALMRVAALEPGDLDARAVGFRLGPRLNAAGRLRRADAALELILTEDERRAAEVADELDMLNRERRDTETRILFAAEAARGEQADAPAYVLAGEGWHPGVIGIVASRIAERHHRPCVVIGLEAGGGGGRGSGRSIPAFDLHAGLAACARYLRRFGGHRAAAGLEIDAEEVDAFRRAFVGYAASTLSAEDLAPVESVDAVVPATALGLPLAEELDRLEPVGEGNREPALLVPGVRLDRVSAMGDEGQHARFTLVAGGARARGVAFRTPPRSLAGAAGEPHDAAVRLERRDWMGTVEPRVVLRALCPSATGRCRVVGEPVPFWEELERELDADLDLDAPAVAPPGAYMRTNGGRALSDRRGESIAGVAGELLSSGEPVLVLLADGPRRREGLERVIAGLARSSAEPGMLAVASWDAVRRAPDAVEPIRHLLAIDPPPVEVDLTLARSNGRGTVHLAWGTAEVQFALSVAHATLDLRDSLTDLYRGIRGLDTVAGDDLRALVQGIGDHPRSPALAGRLIRVLSELRLIEYRRADTAGPVCRLLEPASTALDRSPAWRAYQRRLRDAQAYLGTEAGGLAPSVPGTPASIKATA